MKFTKVLKRTSVLLVSLSLLAFASCTNPDASKQPEDDNSVPKTENPDSGSKAYSLNFNEDISELKVNVGETITLTIKEKIGTWKYDDVNSSAETEVTFENDTLTIKGLTEVEKATIILYPEEAGDNKEFDVTLNVCVYNPLFTLKLTLDEELAKSANSISVKYNSSEHSTQEVAIADYEAGATVATALLEKSVADSWDCFSNIVITILDSQENPLVINQSVDWFKYSDTSFSGITLSASSADATMTLKIVLKNMENAASVKVITVNSNDEKDCSEEYKSSVENNAACFTISKHGAWEKIKTVTIFDAENVEITGYALSGNDWWQWSDDGEVTVSYVLDTSVWTQIGDSIEYKGTKSLIPILSNESFNSITSYETIKIVINVTEWAGSDWATITADSDWTNKVELTGNNEGYVVTLNKTDNETFLTAAAENGILLGTSAGQKSIVSLYYQ